MTQFPSAVDGQRAVPLTNVIHAGANAHQKGEWVTLGIGACKSLLLTFVPVNDGGATDYEFLVDVGLQLGGIKAIFPEYMFLAQNLLVLNSNPSIAQLYTLPLEIPPDIPIVVRAQCNTAGSKVVRAYAQLLGGGLRSRSYSQITTYGVDPTVSRGTVVTAGAVSNQLGSWVEITAATTAPIRELIIAFDMPYRIDADALWDFASGASGQEVAFLSRLLVVGSDTSPFPSPVTFPIEIPAGSRIAARNQNNLGAVTWGVGLYGIS